MTTRNEAAERLRIALFEGAAMTPMRRSALIDVLDEALAAERRATVERIREQVDLLPYWDKRSVPGGLHVNRNAVRTILDEEAAR
jgi:hypothetical protein